MRIVYHLREKNNGGLLQIDTEYNQLLLEWFSEATNHLPSSLASFEAGDSNLTLPQLKTDGGCAREITSRLFTAWNADTPDGERFLQRLPGRFPCFAPISSVSP
jgi:hypothetical protein